MQTSPFSKSLFIGISLLAATGLVACSDDKSKGAPQMPPSIVSIVTAKEESIPVTNELPGRITATRIAEVRPRISGIITERVFTQGSNVKEGDVLYRIDPESFRLQVESAKANLERAQAAQLQAHQQADRSKELQARNVASKQSLENSVAALAQANADVAAAKAALATAELNLQYADVKAPISGRIGRALITEGALVGTGADNVLATIQQLDPIYADFTQSVNDLLNLRRAAQDGKIVGANESEAPVHLVYDDGTPYKHAGRLLFSEATVDETTGQVIMRGEFPNLEGELLPGMYVRIQIQQGVQQGAIAVPKQAVQRDTGGQAFVYLVNENNIAEMRPVKAGRVVDERWVISEGLKQGDKIVVEGFQKIRPGAPVAPQEWKLSHPTATVAEDARNHE